MDIKQLIYFLAIAEEENISRAAEKVHIAQPPLSKQLQLLEEELGVKLVERSTRKLQITSAGEILQHRAKQILDLLDSTIEEVKDISEGLSGTLSIGTVSSAGATLLPEKIYSFHKKYPNLNFEILDEDTYKIIELLKSGLIDIGIIRTPYNIESFGAITIPDEPMVAISTTPFSNDEEAIYLNYLIDKPLIVQKRYEKTLIDLCLNLGFKPRILCKSNDVRTVLLWLTIGMGIAIVPKNSISLILNTKVYYKEIKESSLKVGTAIIWNHNRYMSSAAKHFLETLKEIN